MSADEYHYYYYAAAAETDLTSRAQPTVELDNVLIRKAVALWHSDEDAARETYGDIRSWNTSGVTDMSGLSRQYSPSASDIGFACFGLLFF